MELQSSANQLATAELITPDTLYILRRERGYFRLKFF